MLVVRCSEMQNATRMSRSVSLTNDVREVTACLLNKSDAYLFSPSLARCACAHGARGVFVRIDFSLSCSLSRPMLIHWTMNPIGQIAQPPMFVK